MAEAGGNNIGTLYYTVQYQVDQQSLQRVQQAGAQAGLSPSQGGGTGVQAAGGGFGQQTMAPAPAGGNGGFANVTNYNQSVPAAGTVRGRISAIDVPGYFAPGPGAMAFERAEAVRRGGLPELGNTLRQQATMFPAGSEPWFRIQAQVSRNDTQLANMQQRAYATQQAMADRADRQFDLAALAQQREGERAFGQQMRDMARAGSPLAYATQQQAYMASEAGSGNLNLGNDTLLFQPERPRGGGAGRGGRSGFAYGAGYLARRAFFMGVLGASEYGRAYLQSERARVGSLGASDLATYYEQEYRRPEPYTNGFFGGLGALGLEGASMLGVKGFTAPSQLETQREANLSTLQAEGVEQQTRFEQRATTDRGEIYRSTTGRIAPSVRDAMMESADVLNKIKDRRDQIETQIIDLKAIISAANPQTPEEREIFQSNLRKYSALESESLNIRFGEIPLARAQGAEHESQARVQVNTNIGAQNAAEDYYRAVRQQSGRVFAENEYTRRLQELQGREKALAEGPQNPGVAAERARISEEIGALQPQLEEGYRTMREGYGAQNAALAASLNRQPLEAQQRTIQYEGKLELDKLPTYRTAERATVAANTRLRSALATQQYNDQTAQLRLGLTGEVAQSALQAEGKDISAAAQGAYTQASEQALALDQAGRPEEAEMARRAGANRLAAIQRRAVFGGHAQRLSSPFDILAGGGLESESDVTGTIASLQAQLAGQDKRVKLNGEVLPGVSALAQQSVAALAGMAGGTTATAAGGSSAVEEAKKTNDMLMKILEALQQI